MPAITLPANATAISLKITLALKQKNLHILEQRYWEVSDPLSDQYQSWMSIREINKIVGPAPADKRAVVKWLMNGMRFSMLSSIHLQVV
jgi:hypothetical protein